MNKYHKSCLLVEDDPEDRAYFIDVLRTVSSSAGCYAVANGEEALFALLNDDFQPDYLFTDLNMPRMDGFEFLKLLSGIEKFKDIPVVVYSGDFGRDQIERLKELHVTAVYSKTRRDVLSTVLARLFTDPGER